MLKKLFVSIIIILLIGCTKYEINEEEKTFYNSIKIDKLNINQSLNISSVYEEVNGIVIFKEYSMPNENGKVVIGAHSGIGKNAYFNDLILLKQGDIITIDYNNKEYTYKVNELKEVKDTQTNILESKEENILILLTCKLKDDTKRIIVKAQNISVQLKS